jgi:hypothetical protein
MSNKKLDAKISEVLQEFGIENQQLVNTLVTRFVDSERQSRAFDCPVCKTRLAFKLDVVVNRVRTLEDAYKEKGETPAPAKCRFSEGEVAFLAETKNNGLFKAFAETVDKLTNIGVKPRDVERYFLTWIGSATKVKVPQFSLRSLIDEFPGRYLQVYASQYIAAVVVDDKLMAFYPYKLLKGEAHSNLTASGAQITSTKNTMTTEIWRRGRYGYVVGKGAFFSEMQKHSKGAFANS